MFLQGLASKFQCLPPFSIDVYDHDADIAHRRTQNTQDKLIPVPGILLF